MNRVESPNVGFVIHGLRKLATIIPGEIIFRNEKPKSSNGLEKAKELSRKNCGIVVVIAP